MRASKIDCVTIDRDDGHQVSGVYVKSSTEPGQLVNGMLLGDKDNPSVAWILGADATVWPVARASLVRS
jgi:hypothetical protein